MITYEDGSQRKIPVAFIGVWVDNRPAGRIRRKADGFHAYTNQRAPGQAHLGVFASMHAAGDAIAKARSSR